VLDGKKGRESFSVKKLQSFLGGSVNVSPKTDSNYIPLVRSWAKLESENGLSVHMESSSRQGGGRCGCSWSQFFTNYIVFAEGLASSVL
jgi:hypothetical protein